MTNSCPVHKMWVTANIETLGV